MARAVPANDCNTDTEALERGHRKEPTFRIIDLQGIPWSEEDLVNVLQTEPRSAFERARRRRLHEALSSELHRRAWPILKVMVRDGRIDALAPYPVSYKPGDRAALQDSEAVRDDLVADVITEAMARFWSYAIDEKAYRPIRAMGSASLLTFFIGGAIRAYPDVYPQWSTIRHDRARDDFAEMTDRPAADPRTDDRLDLEASFEEVAALARPIPQQLLILQRLGYSPTEAGAALGITARAVEGHMRRLRSTVAAARRHGRIRSPWDTRPEPQSPLRRLDLAAPTRADLRKRGSVVR